MPFEMEAWCVDVAVTGSQKGLMTPPGLGLVAAGPRAIQAHQLAGLRTAYWDWTKRDGALHYQKYCGTPPEHLLFGLRQAIDMLFEEGLEAVYRRHRSEEHTSELQSLMRISYAVFCLKKKKNNNTQNTHTTHTTKKHINK